ncbi:hypothetical protein SDC9_51528 [bioreactor metagenome]|uniref:Glycosyltransferase RgtA/B/C/D-like domain-containing protein n=1 Tax=bioreactor metagenome TaxID=1076179 RepID=A0A644WN59_9ZZZZ
MRLNHLKIRKTWLVALLSTGVLVGLFFFFRMYAVMYSGPWGIHIMRQSDSLSFASQYYNHGYHFFEPQLFNLKNADGKAACEFPLLYYITALLYLVFGKNFLILKLLNLSVLYFGIFNIFRLACGILKDYFYAALIALFLFTSTVFNYYSFNYLPDSAALGLVFSGWYYIFRYLSGRRKKALVAGFVFFTMGSLIKITYLINPLSIMVLAAFSLIKKNKGYIPAEKCRKIIWYGIAGILPVAIWTGYVLWYNHINHSTSFNTTILPIWNMSHSSISNVWDHMRHYWHSNYFYQSSFHLLFVFIVLQIIMLRKSDLRLIMLLCILLLGSAAYWMLFYSQFQDHDYYFLAFFPFVLFLLLSVIRTMQKVSSRLFLHVALKIVIAVIIVAGINYSRMKLSQRYNAKPDQYSITSFRIQQNKREIDKLNIPADAKILVAPDPCQNGGLFFLNRMGWTLDSLSDVTADTIQFYKNKGADYVLLATSDSACLSAGSASGEQVLIGKDIGVFQLKK